VNLKDKKTLIQQRTIDERNNALKNIGA